MSLFFEMVLFSLLAGSTVFIGAVLSFIFEKYVNEGFIKEEIIHIFIAFGAGIMLSAISFVLIPEGVKFLETYTTVFIFFLGTICFYFFDEYIKKKKTKASQLTAMLLDFIPESISLGAMFVINHSVAVLLAIFIALQNLPESFNTYIELKNSKISSKNILITLFFLSFIGLFFSLLGYFLLKNIPSITASLMIFSSGGILYIIFQDIAPAFRLKQTNLPVLGVNIGFIVGLLCQLSI